jgi:hypothetical protein
LYILSPCFCDFNQSKPVLCNAQKPLPKLSQTFLD